MPDRCGHVWRDRLTFELFQAEDGFEEFASAILAAKGRNSHLYFTFSYSHCGENDISCEVCGACDSLKMSKMWSQSLPHRPYT